MPLRRRGEDSAPDRQAAEAAAAADAELSLERLLQGGIPVTAERRLRELSAGAGAFTSDLSVAGFSLTHGLGLQPIAQVMGSCVYQVGYQPGAYGFMNSIITELGVLSDAWNEARRLAFDRLAQEARAAGAQAVVGVGLRTGVHDFAAEAIEYVVVGTAVREAGAPPAEHPVMTELSVADYVNLRASGYAPAGVVANTAVFYAEGWLSGGTGMFGNQGNFEYREFTQAVYEARERVMGRLGQQASRFGAEGIVGARIGHQVRATGGSGGGPGQRPPGAMITFDAIGTAIRRTGELSPPAPRTTVDLTT